MDGVRVYLDGVTEEQQHLLTIYAWAYGYYAGDAFWHALSGQIERRLAEQGVYACYDDEEDTYTYLRG